MPKTTTMGTAIGASDVPHLHNVQFSTVSASIPKRVLGRQSGSPGPGGTESDPCAAGAGPRAATRILPTAQCRLLRHCERVNTEWAILDS